MKLLFFFAFLLLANINRSCDSSVEQGLAGQVLWLEGDMMPTINDAPDVNRKQLKGEPVQRTLHIHELTTMDQATAEGPFFRDIQTELVETVETNEEGQFIVSLPAGRYSVFVQEQDGLFANMFDGEGYINPVEIKEDEITKIKIEVNYKATY